AATSTGRATPPTPTPTSPQSPSASAPGRSSRESRWPPRRRPSTTRWRRRAAPWWRPTSASGSSSSPATRRVTSSRRPSARAGTGQHLSTYTNIITGPRRENEADGPDELHVVILDNGRSDVVGTELHEILNCIRCGACLNVCPVYRQVGGHAYGWVYSGPVGAVLTPLLAADHAEAAEVANASTLCGACMDACPVQIPLQDLLLSLRRRRAATA